MTDTSIEWTQKTWNPIRGCTRVSSGCKNCYAERVAHRFSGPGQPYEGLTVLSGGSPRWAGKARFVPEMLAAPLKWKAPQRVFVNSMSDLFHEDVSAEQIAAVFGVMASCPQHTFQILTKRPERMRRFASSEFSDPRTCIRSMLAIMPGNVGDPVFKRAWDEATWPLPNVWLGVSAEDQDTADERVPILLDTPAAVRFVSAEPLLGLVDLTRILWPDMSPATGVFDALVGGGRKTDTPWKINWVIVGGESGPKSRQCTVEWMRDIVRQCKRAGVACFVKQLGSCYVDAENAVGGYQAKPPPEYGKLSRRLVDRKGGDMTEWPIDLCVREFPEA